MKASKLSILLHLVSCSVLVHAGFCFAFAGQGIAMAPCHRVNNHRPRSRLQSSFDNLAGHDDEDEDDDESIKPYGNRSIAWTNRYRKLLPYEWAREQAMKLGLRSKEEWNDYLADGRVYQNNYLPTRPDEMYADEWTSWEDFLGIMRSYDDTRYIVQKVLRIQSMQEYTAFIAADTKRAEGLRIPYKPEIVYRDKGWNDADHFFTSDNDAEDNGDYRCCM